MRKPEKPVQVKFYTDLAVRVLRDQAAICNLRSSDVQADVNTLRRRVSVEGLSFLTKTLPSLGKCLDKALSSDCPLPTGHGFKLSNRAPNHPVFLGGFWKLVFDKDGMVAELPVREARFNRQVAAVRAIRQICYLLYKLDGICDEKANQAVIDMFVETDQSLPDETEEVPLSNRAQSAINIARELICYALKDFDPREIRPGHGPGAVSTGEQPWEKMNFSRYYVKLDQLYSYPEYFYFNMTHLVDELETLEALEEVHTATAKVVLVPKDSRGPRLISMEPLELQWIQQGVMRELVREIERPRNCTGGYVNFTDQTINRDLAHANSFYGDMVTVDMKEASDRVSLWLVRKLFPEHVFEYLKACRSEETELPDGHRLRLKKFAPMGSSVCFPVEALTFWALAVGSVVEHMPWGLGLNPNYLPPVYVYGDDIIAHKSDYETFRPIFEELSLKFNEDKCCTGRFFRESCGMDAFAFEDVVPARIKAQWPDTGKLSPATTMSYVSYCNSLRQRGCLQASTWLRKQIEQKSGLLPRTNDEQRSLFAICEPEMKDSEVVDYLLTTFASRYNKRLQRWEVKVKQPRPVYIKHGEPDWSQLLRCSVQGSSSNSSVLAAEQRLGPCRYAVPHLLKMRWTWVAVEQLLKRA